MTSVRVTAVLRESASFGVASRADYRQDTYDHVPGSVLRGALAAAWLRTPGTAGSDEPRFREVFEGTGTFGPLHSAASLPVPLSVWTHKANPRSDCTQLWWDAVDATVPSHCPLCRGPLVQSKGQPMGRPALRERTRVAIDDTGVAEYGQLFRRTAVAAGTVLTGWVCGPAAEALSPGGTQVTSLRFGGERSIRGRADITAETSPPPQLESRGPVVILRLAAPGVFVDRFGHPTDKPAKAELAKVLGLRTKDVTVDRCWTRWTEVGGWHLASGLPKPRDRAVAAGSTYQVTCANVPEPDRLVALAEQGVGLRRREGFGALCQRPPEPLGDSPLFAALEPLLRWSRWPEFGLLLMERAAGRTPRIVIPESMSSEERSALNTLLGLQDRTLLQRLLVVMGVTA